MSERSTDASGPGSASNTESSPTQTVAASEPTAPDYHFELRFMDDEKVDFELDLDHEQIVLEQDDHRLSISLSGGQFNAIKDLPILADRLTRAPGTTAGDVERARAMRRQIWGEDRTGSYVGDRTLADIVEEYIAKELKAVRASARAELLAQIREPSAVGLIADLLAKDDGTPYMPEYHNRARLLLRALADKLAEAK